MYHETWRIERDFLYDPHTHGLNIPKIEAKYKPYLDALASRSEFGYLSTESLGEVTIGHMFIRAPRPQEHNAKTGLLSADYKTENGRYRIAKILGGQNWTPGLASPLTLPGVSVKEGEYLLTVNENELKADDNLYEFIDGTAGKQTVLCVGVLSAVCCTRLINPRSQNRNLHPTDKDLSLHPSAQRSCAGDPEFVEIRTWGTQAVAEYPLLFVKNAKRREYPLKTQ